MDFFLPRPYADLILNQRPEQLASTALPHTTGALVASSHP